MEQAKPILTKQLERLFGSDGVDDVLDYLLGMESMEEVKTSLEQLLGKDKDTRSFIEDMERVKQGQMPLNVVMESTTIKSQTTTEPTPPPRAVGSNSRKQAPVVIGQQPKKAFNNNNRPTTKMSALPKAWLPPAQQVPNKTTPKKQIKNIHPKNNAITADPAKLIESTPTLEKKVVVSTMTKTTTNPPDIAATSTTKSKMVSTPPLRGKPVVVCGCFGNLHKPLANCLYCGRISCEQEGYSYCAFCGYLVEKGEENSDDEAWKHKERLLRYDRESAQRTVIIDDQADYYSSSAWLTEAEEEKAKEAEQIHYDKMHRRGGSMKLNIG